MSAQIVSRKNNKYTKKPPQRIKDKYINLIKPKKVKAKKTKYKGTKCQYVNIQDIKNKKGIQLVDKDGDVVFQWRMRGTVNGTGDFKFREDTKMEAIE